MDTLSSRSPQVSKDRGATRIVFTQWIDLVYMSYQKVRFGSNASGECFFGEHCVLSASRSNEPSRDRGATRERKLTGRRRELTELDYDSGRKIYGCDDFRC